MELGIILPNSEPLASADAMYRVAEHALALGFDERRAPTRAPGATSLA